MIRRRNVKGSFKEKWSAESVFSISKTMVSVYWFVRNILNTPILRSKWLVARQELEVLVPLND